MGGEALRRRARGLHETAINISAIAHLGNIAFRRAEKVEERPGRNVKVEFVHEVEHPRRILHYLDGFEPGDFREEPSAAGIHEHRGALHLEQVEGAQGFGVAQTAPRMAGKKLVAPAPAPEHHADVVVTRRPRIAKEIAGHFFEVFGGTVAQQVERLPQGPTPCLVPTFLATGLAPTIAVPAADSVRATPGSAFAVWPRFYLHLVSRRILLEEFSVIRDVEVASRGLGLEGVGDTTVAEAKMMPVAFTVGCDVDKLAVATAREIETLGQLCARGEGVFERDGTCQRVIIKEQGDRTARAVAMEVTVREARVDAAVGNVAPFLGSDRAHALSLMRRHDRVRHPGVDQGFEGCVVACGLRHPEGFGITAKAMTKIRNAPNHLRTTVALVAKRQNRMIVALSNRIAMAVSLACALAVGLEDARIGFRMCGFEPIQKRGAKIETEV